MNELENQVMEEEMVETVEDVVDAVEETQEDKGSMLLGLSMIAIGAVVVWEFGIKPFGKKAIKAAKTVWNKHRESLNSDETIDVDHETVDNETVVEFPEE